MKTATIMMVSLLLLVAHGMADETISGKPRILLLTKSAGFEHSVIKNDASGSSHVERIMLPLAQEMGASITCTKDASLLNETALQNYDVVIFYTSGNLTETGTDGHPAMSVKDVDALLQWIQQGGGFIGFHSATDSFRSSDDAPTPFIEMIGAEFVKHGRQFEGTIKKTSPSHPAITSLPERWSLQDEWYLFKHFNASAMHVLAVLEIGKERQKQRMYNIPDYPMIWCRSYGQGRVLYNGMGHREDVWEHPTFKSLVVEHIRWAAGQGDLQADPNYNDLIAEQKTQE